MHLAVFLVAFVLTIVSVVAQDTNLCQVKKTFGDADVCNNDCLTRPSFMVTCTTVTDSFQCYSPFQSEVFAGGYVFVS